MRRSSIGLIALVALAACSPARQSEVAPPPAAENVLHIQNPYPGLDAISVYLVPASGPRRLVGRLATAQPGSMRFYLPVTASYHLVAEGPGHSRVTSTRIVLSPGSTLRWNLVGNNLIVASAGRD